MTTQLQVIVFLPNIHAARELAQKILQSMGEQVGETVHILPEAVTYYRELPNTVIEVDQEAVLVFRIPNSENTEAVIGFVKAEHPLEKPEVMVATLVE